MKECNVCKNLKTIENFYKDKTRKDGLSPRCIPCQRVMRNKTPSYQYNYKKKYRQLPHVKKANRIRALKYYHETKNVPILKLKRSLRGRINQAFKANSWIKKGSSEKLLGCSYTKAKDHISNLFKEGMSWENHGEWHIDHKIPLYEGKTEEELIKLCHYTNLQPLWAKDNLKKNKY